MRRPPRPAPTGVSSSTRPVAFFYRQSFWVAVVGVLALLFLGWQFVGRATLETPATRPSEPRDATGAGSIKPTTQSSANDGAESSAPDVSEVAGGHDENADDANKNNDVAAGLKASLDRAAVAVSVGFQMSAAMDVAWRTSSKRLSFESKMSFAASDPVFIGIGGGEGSDAASAPAVLTFYGKSSLKIRYTSRRSLHVTTQRPVRIAPDAPPLTNFLLLSLWEDTYRIAYRSAIVVLQELGLFFAYARIVELRCDADASADDKSPCRKRGGTLGAYLLVEYPSDAIARSVRVASSLAAAAASSGEVVHEQVARIQPFRSLLTSHMCESKALESARREAIRRSVGARGTTTEVATRNWFYFEKPSRYDLLHVPSYSRNSTLSAPYRKLEQNPLAYSLGFRQQDAASDELAFDMPRYLAWIATNTILQNGDYDDEVFFYSSGSYLGMMAWDYDNTFAACHRKGANAVRSEIMFCAETPLERLTLQDRRLNDAYVSSLSCLLDGPLSEERWGAAVSVAVAEVEAIHRASSKAIGATFDDKPKCCPDVAEGGRELRAQHQARRRTLLKALNIAEKHRATSPAPGGGGGGDKPHRNADGPISGGGVNVAEEGAKCDSPEAAEQLTKDGAVALSKAFRAEYKMKDGSVEVSGKVSVASATVSALTLWVPPHFAARPFEAGSVTLHEAGFYCASATFTSSGSRGRCSVVAHRVFAARGARGKAEFGVAPFERRPLDARVAAEAAVSALSTGLRLRAIVPAQWLGPSAAASAAPLSVFPAVVRVEHENASGKHEWLRRNVLLQPATETSRPERSDGRVVVVRGFSALWELPGRTDQTTKWQIDAVHGTNPERQNERHVTIPNPAAVFDVAAATRGATALPAVVTADIAITRSAAHGSDNTASFCGAVIADKVVIKLGATLSVGPGCSLVLGPHARLVVRGKLDIAGSEAEPVSVLPLRWYEAPSSVLKRENAPLGAAALGSEGSGGGGRWDAFEVHGKAATIRATWAFVVGAGGGPRTKAHGHHHTASAAFAVHDGASLTLTNVFILDSKGPAFTAGNGASVTFTDSLVQWAEMGGECLSCDFTSVGTVWTHFPSGDTAYADEDNDGLYLSGGRHRVIHSVIANTKDDGIDSGTPENWNGDGGSLLVDHSIFESITHEGIALSSSPTSTRHVTVRRSVVRHAQQGIESGYSGRGHTAEVSDVVISGTRVGLRYGDNYHNRPQQGTLTVTRAVLAENDVDVLGYLRHEQRPPKSDAFAVAQSRLLSPFAVGGADAAPCAELFAARNGRDNSFHGGAAVGGDGDASTSVLLSTSEAEALGSYAFGTADADVS